MGKNIRKIQQMLAGEFNKNPQVGYTPERVDRKVGDTWEDSEGIKWEQRKGYKMKISRTPEVGIFPHQCKDCEKNCDSKSFDKDTYKRMGRCYHCQMHFEEDLKFDAPVRLFAYRRLKDFQNMKSIEKDMEQWVYEKQELMVYDEFEKVMEDVLEENAKIDEKPVWDKTVANALATDLSSIFLS